MTLGETNTREIILIFEQNKKKKIELQAGKMLTDIEAYFSRVRDGSRAPANI